LVTAKNSAYFSGKGSSFAFTQFARRSQLYNRPFRLRLYAFSRARTSISTAVSALI
jgi:hypothetical protein